MKAQVRPMIVVAWSPLFPAPLPAAPPEAPAPIVLHVYANGGRDYWTHCYSVLLAGAGIRGGTIHGASDA